MNPEKVITVPNGYDDSIFNHKPVKPYTDKIDLKNTILFLLVMVSGEKE